MQLLCSSFNEMRERIHNNNSKVIMFGAGAIGQVTIPEILKELGVLEYVDCYVDNNQAMWGKTIYVSGRNFEVRSPRYLSGCLKDTIILLNISRFSEVLEQLEDMACTSYMSCYVMPMMLIHNFCNVRSQGNPFLSNEQLIPKIIHYMWLGRGNLPYALQKCMESWEKYCPDYEIMRWDENNYDISKHPYMKEAYAARAYGFVPDYARLDILYNEGGIYLDTDVEIKRNIDDLLFQEAFCGVEKWQIFNFGGMSGARKGHPMIKRFLDAREKIFFLNDDGSQNRNTCGYYDTKVALDNGYKIDGTTQCINGMNIYAYDYFHPYDYMTGSLNETKNTYSVHWFNGGWLDDKMRKANEESQRTYEELYNRALGNKMYV